MTLPYTVFLRAASLVAMASPKGADLAESLCGEFYAPMPPDVDWPVLETSLVKSNLSPALEAAFLTTDVRADHRPFFLAAAELGIADVVGMFATGPSLQLPPAVAAWRRDKTLRVCIETYQLAGVSNEVIAGDLKKMYGRDFNTADLERHRTLFADREWLGQPGGWEAYEACIGAAEAKFKREMAAQPEDYLRWKMGVPVTLDSDTVLDRMISDAYYAERELKRTSSSIGKDEMARLKMERDTIFKALDRKMKKKALELEAGGAGGSVSEVVAAIEKFSFKYAVEEPPLMDSLNDGT